VSAQRVVHGRDDGLAGLQAPVDHESHQEQAQLVGNPTPFGEEAVERADVLPQPTALAARTTPVTVCRPVASDQPAIKVTNVENDGAVKHDVKA